MAAHETPWAITSEVINLSLLASFPSMNCSPGCSRALRPHATATESARPPPTRWSSSDVKSCRRRAAGWSFRRVRVLSRRSSAIAGVASPSSSCHCGASCECSAEQRLTRAAAHSRDQRPPWDERARREETRWHGDLTKHFD